MTGAGRGIGRATALRLAQEGCRLVLVGRTAADLDRVGTDVTGAGGEVRCFPASVTDEEALRQVVAGVEAVWERIDALVNCAGAGSFAPVESVLVEAWRRIIETNLTGTFLACRAVLPGP